MEEDRSGLFSEIGGFSQRKLKKVQTKVVTGTGETVVEKRSAKGIQASTADAAKGSNQDSSDGRKRDLQVGMVLPGLMIASHDVAESKATLDEYGITHILNLASEEIDNKFEDDLNYCSLDIDDSPRTQLKDYFEQCFEFIEEGKFRGNCLVHCDGSKHGLSRSTAICVAFLMSNQKMRFNDAYNEVKEARSLTKPNDGFLEQLRALDGELFGKKKKDNIEDPFTLKKRKEIEAEKAMLNSGVKLKDRVKLFADTVSSDRERSQSPASLGILKNRGSWNPDSPGNVRKDDRDDRRSSFVPDYKNPDGSPAPKVKLTSIISLFNKPSREEMINEQVASIPRPLFPINKNTTPVKKWATVAPPPKPGVCQVKRNKSRRWLNQSSVRRNKSKANFADSVKRTKSREFKLAAQQQSQDGDQEVKVDDSSRGLERPAIRRQRSRQKSTEEINEQEPEVVDKATVPVIPVPPVIRRQRSRQKSTEEIKEQDPEFVVKATVPVIPVPPPLPPLDCSNSVKATVKEVPESPTSPDENLTPWRRRSSGSRRRRKSLKSQSSTESEASIIPKATEDKPRYRTSISITSTKSPSRQATIDVEDELVAAPVIPIPPPPPPPPMTLPPAVAPAKLVFGKAPAPKSALKITPAGLSVIAGHEEEDEDEENVKTTAVIPAPPPPPPPPPMVMASNKTSEPKTADKTKKAFKKSVSIVASSSSDESSEEEERAEQLNCSNEDANIGQGYAPNFDSRRVSDVKGLNRSSTMEIMQLIKSRTGVNLSSDLSNLDTVDEDDEIETLLDGLEEEGIDNIDWGELGIELDEVKDIVGKHEDDEETETETEDDEDDDEEEDEETMEDDSDEDDKDEKDEKDDKKSDEVIIGGISKPAINNATFVINKNTSNELTYSEEEEEESD